MGSELNKKETKFITSLELNEKSKNTIEKYGRDIKGFIKWCEENEVGTDSIEKIARKYL